MRTNKKIWRVKMSIFDKCFGFKKRRAAFTQEANKDRKFVIERQSKDINLEGLLLTSELIHPLNH